MDLEFLEIVDLQKQVSSKEHELYELRKILKQKEDLYQGKCPHEEFFAEDNGDYHKPGYYFICTKCKYWTCIRPTGKKLVYAR